MSAALQDKPESRTSTDKRKPSATRSILAGGLAGGIEIGDYCPRHIGIAKYADDEKALHILPNVRWHALYRFLQLSDIPEIVAKTRVQLNRNLPAEKKLGWPKFGRDWYAGCSTLVIGNALKAGIRWCPPSSACNVDVHAMVRLRLL